MYTVSSIQREDLGVIGNYISELPNGKTSTLLWDIASMDWDKSIKVELKDKTIVGFCAIKKDMVITCYIADAYRKKVGVVKPIRQFLLDNGGVFSYKELYNGIPLVKRANNNILAVKEE